ncbi:winged helix-turn-helix transcriptional regulator [Compostimonas suwonensis]|uniref:DNA-binding HxlR family transcriptional regulator n=1 Tax=Compostimonas suwonensis TaxID=1048394 RepID=A0A2M9BTX4_9MICO|nr:helix-turn-helix domain-containing protein [Compostimonas suwonensis]PJJ61397.1 DNA-binding HxlR family transcriptional regulator [Compostimonas suwonensis]
MATRKPRPEPRCSIHRSIDLLGERWTLLIVRNAFRGQTRFSEFRDALGVPSDILSARLATLTEAGVLERRAYRDEGSRERFSYHLTESGRELKLVLVALQTWGDANRQGAAGPASLTRKAGTDTPVTLALVDPEGARLGLDEVDIVPGPGATTSW